MREPVANSKLQCLMDEIKVQSDTKQMKINEEKNSVILFNKAKKYDFMHNLTIGDSLPLKVVKEIQLLGVVASSDLSWAKTLNLCVQKLMLDCGSLGNLIH